MSARDASEFLKALAGQWRAASEGPEQASGTTTTRVVSAYWVVLDTIAESKAGPVRGHLLLGYDLTEGRFRAAGVNSATNALTHMTGSLESPSRLVLHYEVSAPGNPQERLSYRDITTLESKDRYTVTSEAQMDGRWAPIISITNERITE